ncbi:MAG: 1-acyl-sn-glycerol-3-phosphate acyltransferase [Candidatus Aminicenantes bacterium]|nr:1-acyl-sn-glycerol-3-phosphate acyltransferase [Candidatus Aminicenantes bacterium]
MSLLIVIPILLVCFLLRMRRPLFAFAKAALSLIRALAGIRADISGLENIDRKKAYVFMSNHLSFIDGPLLFLIIPQPVRVILKKQVFRLPILGQGMRFADFVPVNRKGARQGWKAVDLAASLMRTKKHSFLIFPEGTRSRDGRMQPFKKGGFFLARAAGAPVVPVSISGTFALMPRGSLFIRPGRVRVRFHPPLEAAANNGDPAELIVRTREAVVSGLAEEEPWTSGNTSGN